MTTTRRKRLLLSALAILCFPIGVVWLVAGEIAAPAHRSVGFPPPTLPDARHVAFLSESGTMVQAWLATPKASRGAIVLAHGVRADRREMLGRAEFLVDAGFSVLLFDAQAHGETGGTKITFGHLEARDAAAAVAFARAQHPGAPIGYIGLSQGGAAALLGRSPLPVSALVLEAVYPTLHDVTANRLEIRLGHRGRMLAPLLLWPMRWRIGVPPEQIAPIRGARHIEAPLLLIAGERDRLTTLEESRALFAAAPGPKELWVVPDAEHQDFQRLRPAEYRERVLGFLARHLHATGRP